MPEPTAESGVRPLVGLILGPLLFAFLVLVPAPAGLSGEAMRMAAVAALMAVWWITEAIPIPATALLPLPLFPLLGILDAGTTPSSYADRMIYLFFGGFLIAVAMQNVGLHRRIALRIIGLIGGSPSRLVLGFMIATAFLSLWISNTATTMMMLPIAMAVVLQMSEGGGTPHEQDRAEMFRNNFGLVLMLGIAYSASIGGIGTLVGTPPNIVMAGFVRKLYPAAPEIDFLQWMLLGLPLVIVFIPLAWFYLVRWGSPVPVRSLGVEAGLGREYISGELDRLGPMSRGERIVAAVFCLAAFGWIFRQPINLGFYTTWGLTNLFPLIDDSTVSMTMGTALFLLPRGIENGRIRFVLDWKTARAGVPWGILILYGGGFALARGMEVTGLALWIGERLTWLSGVPVPVVILCTCLLLTFLTEITSNTATTTMLIPVLASAAVAMGAHPFLLMIPAAISASCAFMLPVATPPNAIIFGSGWVRIPQMAKAGIWLNLIGAVLVTALVCTLGLTIFDIDPSQLPEWATRTAQTVQ